MSRYPPTVEAWDRCMEEWMHDVKLGEGTGLRVRVTAYLDPRVVLGVAIVVSGLTAAVDGLPLTGRRQIVRAGKGGSLSLVHLGLGGWIRRRWRGSGNRHEQWSREKPGREGETKRTEGMVWSAGFPKTDATPRRCRRWNQIKERKAV